MKQGFTVVELIVVIVVLAVLVAITTVGYGWMQDDSRDTARRASVQQIISAVDALKMKTDQTLMVGGYKTGTLLGLDSNGLCQYNATTAYTSNTGSNWLYYQGSYTYFPCTLGQALVANGLLPNNFFESIPERDDGYSKHSQMQSSTSMALYSCDTPAVSSKRWILYYYLKNPTPEEEASIDRLWNSCAASSPTINSIKNTLRMKAAVEIRL